jgi:hypothetical protein
MYQTCIGSVRGKGSVGILWRTCKDRKDYTGGQNHFATWEDLKDMETLAKKMLAA